MTGLYQKFDVSRTDPESEARHQGCRYFVLDVDHDPYAKAALRDYAYSCMAEHPDLADDLFTLIDEPRCPVCRRVGRGSLAVSGTCRACSDAIYTFRQMADGATDEEIIESVRALQQAVARRRGEQS